MSTIPILIAGAGPAGLFLALWLAKSGIKVRIIDKSDSYHIGSRGTGIQPRSFELMQVLGILDDALKLATPVPTMRAYKLPGGIEPIKTWDLYSKSDTVWPDRPYGDGLCLNQEIHEDIIRKHLAKYGVLVELGKELTAIEQNAEFVTCTVVDHNSGKEETINAEYLAGADGARGASRKLLGLTFQGETRDTDGMVWGNVEIKGLTSDYWHMWGKPGHFTVMARPQTPTRKEFIFGITGQNFDPAGLEKPEKIKEFFYEHTGRTDLQFGEFIWLTYFKPNMRLVNRFSEGRAFIVGDAGHVHSPTGGQGLNSSLQDSSNLAWKLALVIKKLAPPSILSSYNDERLPVIAQILLTTTQLYTHTIPQVKVDEKPEKPDDDKATGWYRWRNNALQMYGINYRYSDLVLEERDSTPQDLEDMKARAFQGYEGLGSLRAGDRAPEAPALITNDGKATSLFALFQPSSHTILVFTPEENRELLEAVMETTSTYPKDTLQILHISDKQLHTSIPGMSIFFDKEGHAHNAYMVPKGESAIIIVRPDTFIGANVRDVSGVSRYLAKIYVDV